MDNKEYVWDGDWDGPGWGSYVICENGREMEPAEVIELLNELSDLKEQLARRPQLTGI